MQANKTLIALVAVVVVAAGAYYMLAGSVEAPTAMNTDALPAATDSVEDFGVALDADLQATASALNAFDAELDASVSDLEGAGDSTNLYDPENI